MTDGLAAWAALAGLGAFHGLNPGMGWLFAVALGLQERSRRAVLEALPPIALGHALAVVAALALLQAARVVVPPTAVPAGSGAVLVAFGVYRLAVRRHPRWVGMRVSARELVVWSFVMASVHGAGLMLIPVLLRDQVAGLSGPHPVTGLAAAAVVVGGDTPVMVGAAAVHTAAMLAMMLGVALVVYDHVGLAVLRRGWVNLDLVWAAALVGAGLFAFAT